MNPTTAATIAAILPPEKPPLELVVSDSEVLVPVPNDAVTVTVIAAGVYGIVVYTGLPLLHDVSGAHGVTLSSSKVCLHCGQHHGRSGSDRRECVHC